MIIAPNAPLQYKKNPRKEPFSFSGPSPWLAKKEREREKEEEGEGEKDRKKREEK